MIHHFQKLLFFMVFVISVKGNAIDSLSGLLPVSKGLRLGMSIDDFKQINQTADDINGEPTDHQKFKTRVFGEDVEKGEIGLISN